MRAQSTYFVVPWENSPAWDETKRLWRKTLSSSTPCVGHCCRAACLQEASWHTYQSFREQKNLSLGYLSQCTLSCYHWASVATATTRTKHLCSCVLMYIYSGGEAYFCTDFHTRMNATFFISLCQVCPSRHKNITIKIKDGNCGVMCILNTDSLTVMNVNWLEKMWPISGMTDCCLVLIKLYNYIFAYDQQFSKGKSNFLVFSVMCHSHALQQAPYWIGRGDPSSMWEKR